jgi:hypothetical protein
VLADIISGAVPVVRLTEVFRQAAQSRIITNAHRINRGEMPDLEASEGGDFYFVDAADPEDAVKKLVKVGSVILKFLTASSAFSCKSAARAVMVEASATMSSAAMLCFSSLGFILSFWFGFTVFDLRIWFCLLWVSCGRLGSRVRSNRS